MSNLGGVSFASGEQVICRLISIQPWSSLRTATWRLLALRDCWCEVGRHSKLFIDEETDSDSYTLKVTTDSPSCEIVVGLHCVGKVHIYAA